MAQDTKKERRKKVRELLMTAEGAYLNAAAWARDMVDGTKSPTLSNIRSAIAMIYACESEGQRAMSGAASLLDKEL